MIINGPGVSYSFNLSYQKPKKKGGLPDFLIIGAQKCGTTALAANLDRHPRICMAIRDDGKRAAYELRFFVNKDIWRRGEKWYRGLFPNNDMVQGEKTPEYIYKPIAHERMARVVPEAKLILLIRNPVDRAYSAWNHFMHNGKYKSEGFLEESFEAALAASLRGDIDALTAVVDKGVYIRQIRNLLRYYKREQLFIGISERFKKDPVGETRRVFQFLGVDVIDVDAELKHVRKYKSPMNPAIREFLQAYYRPYNEELFELLGCRIPEWEESSSHIFI